NVMASPSRNASKPAFLPPAVTAFLRRRLTEVAGLAIGAAGIAGLAALISYDPTDPSFNVAGEGATHNWLGRPGASAADLLMQTIGFAGWALALVLVIW